jgi:hypothetical protein
MLEAIEERAGTLGNSRMNLELGKVIHGFREVMEAGKEADLGSLPPKVYDEPDGSVSVTWGVLDGEGNKGVLVFNVAPSKLCEWHYAIRRGEEWESDSGRLLDVDVAQLIWLVRWY